MPKTMMALALVLVGCGDQVSATGALGNLSYGLGIDYEVDGDLTEVSLLTGHAQSISVRMTPDGEDIARDPWLVTHTITPDNGTMLEFDEGEEGDSTVPNMTLTVTEPDLYIVESYYENELLDYIKISFDRPDSLEVLTWIRDPNADDFTESTFNANINVEVGTQVALLPIPYAGSERLVGDFAVDYTYTPEDAVVTVHDVNGVYEQEGVIGSVNSNSLVFVSPETVTVTVTDPANNVSAQRTFTVAP